MFVDSGEHEFPDRSLELLIGAVDEGLLNDCRQVAVKLQVYQVADGGPQNGGFYAVLGTPIGPKIASTCCSLQKSNQYLCGTLCDRPTIADFNEVPALETAKLPLKYILGNFAVEEIIVEFLSRTMPVN